MRAGRAGAVSQAVRQKRALRESNDKFGKYGLKELKVVQAGSDLDKYKPQARDSDIERGSVKQSTEGNRQSDLSEQIRRDTEAGIDHDRQFAEEFDDINREKKNYHPYHGQGELVGRKYLSKSDKEEDMAMMNCQEMTDQRIVFRRFPLIVWFVGFVIVLAGFYLIFHLVLGSQHKRLFEGYREGHWWQYLIAFAMVLFGILFMYAGKVESLTLDNQKGVMSKIKQNIFCRKTQSDWALDQIKNIRVFKRGHDSIQIMTIHFEVQIDFKDVPAFVIIKTQKKDKAIKQMVKLKEFIGLPICKADLKYIDESTTKFKK